MLALLSVALWVSPDEYPEVESLDHVAVLFLAFREASIVLFRGGQATA